MNDIKICYVYYYSEDFTSSCDPIRVDLVIDDVCIESKGTCQYMEYRDVVKNMEDFCQSVYKDSKVKHVCVQDGYENYKFSDKTTEGN